MYDARQPAEELAYREHFLDNDIRQLAVSSYAVTLLLIAMTMVDLSRLADEPVLVNGIGIKIILLFTGLGVARIVAIKRQPRVMDLCALLYTALFAIGLLLTYASNDYSGLRITALTAVFIYTAHFAFPVYASYLLPAMTILIVGEAAMILIQNRADLVLDRPVILIVVLFAQFMSMLASSLHQRARYSIFSALKQVKTRSGFLPICASCKKIRNDDGYYQQIEQYIAENSDAEFTHGICPTCAKDLYGDLGKRK
ncbi:MAG: hypothetical protein QGG54_02975 [Gammaproteobacteria bacterium]|nr:hypothetical protein [Gammaproteobacteria bacterium]